MLRTMLAALSMGPVGISDQLSGRPEDPTATITSNKTLVMATCSTTGDLLQPSYPIVPIERMIIGAGEFGDCVGPTHRAYTYGCGAHVWGTYTAVPVTAAAAAATEGAAGGTGLWWTSIGFFSGRGGSPIAEATLREDDLAPMVDASALPSADFGSVPTAAFTEEGGSFPNATWAGGGGHVVWEGHYVGQTDCTGVEVSLSATPPRAPTCVFNVFVAGTFLIPSHCAFTAGDMDWQHQDGHHTGRKPTRQHYHRVSAGAGGLEAQRPSRYNLPDQRNVHKQSGTCLCFFWTMG